MLGTLAMIGGMGMPELLVILGIAVIIFGAGRIPEIAKALGKSVKEFKKAGDEHDRDNESQHNSNQCQGNIQSFQIRCGC